MHCTGLLTQRLKASFLTRFKANCQEQLSQPDSEPEGETQTVWKLAERCNCKLLGTANIHLQISSASANFKLFLLDESGISL